MYKNYFGETLEVLNNELMEKGFTSMFEAEDFDLNREKGSIGTPYSGTEYGGATTGVRKSRIPCRVTRNRSEKIAWKRWRWP